VKLSAILLSTALCCLFSVVIARAQVSIREEKIEMPTWEIGPPAVHSVFPNPRGPIYPYTLNEILTDRKVTKSYNGVVLENEYIKVLVLPEIGGRLHGALDKTNNYVWLYWQKTIKPGLISMTGAWISGGIEWNFPHGHRPSGFMPVEHRITRNRDGSGSVWVGETEPVYRMRWLVGMTIFPGRSYVRCDYIFINPTNHRQPFQFWATAATHANEWAQAQYPGDMVTGHGKHEFWNWPVHNGVDLTWWKNSPNASSYFAFNNPSDWFGTYDHKAQGGLVHVADHNIMPGKKLWTWGSGPSGRIWEDILSEGGGAYFEPQAGAWSDNQPDYHWMGPHEVRTAHDFWYPVRDTRGYHQANQDFAINTDVRDGVAFAAVYATSMVNNPRIVLKNAKNGAVLFEAMTPIAPDKPFAREIKVQADVSVFDLHLAVYDAKGNPLIELQQQPPKKVELPPGQKDPGDPKRMNPDELYQAGEWLDRFIRTEEALPYYQEALKRNPMDARVNTEMGFLALKQGKWTEALAYLNTALERDYDNSWIYFGKGIACSGLGRFREAEDNFFRATYSYEYFAPAYLNLAKISTRAGEYRRALEQAAQAESQNGKFADIQALAAAANRHLGDHPKALTAAERALQLDPMHFMAGYEKLLALKAGKEAASEWESAFNAILRGATQNYLELASAYAEAGLYAEADAILASFSQGKDETTLYPMVNYLRGYFKEVQGETRAAAEFYTRGTRGPAPYTNPHRLEEKAALEAALKRNPDDANAHLFLGNLLYAMGQREEGYGHWTKAVQCDEKLSLAWRNVGFAENQLKKNLPASLEAYRKTIELAPQDARALLELDQIAEHLRSPAAERLALLEKHAPAVKGRDDLVARQIDLRLQIGGRENLEAAYQSLKTRHFHSWEGGYGIHDSWVEVNQELGDAAFDRKDFAAARRHYEEAREYPGNLEVAARTPDFRAHVNWNLARVHLAQGKPDIANEFLKSIVAEKYNKPHIGTYYQALAQKALKNDDAYRALLDSVEKKARDYVSGKFEYRGNAETIGHVLLALVLEEKGDKAKAGLEFKKAWERDPLARRLAIREAQLDIARAHQ
jgi:tetratricopeptide (TPR) repeat protein